MLRSFDLFRSRSKDRSVPQLLQDPAVVAEHAGDKETCGSELARESGGAFNKDVA
jgi:hypothetical protein